MSDKVKGPMKKPTHTGAIIKRQIFDPLGLSVTAAADHMGISRPMLSRVLNERSSLTWDTAYRIEKAFGPKAEHLMRMQFAYDAAQARARAKEIKVTKFMEEVREQH